MKSLLSLFIALLLPQALFSQPSAVDSFIAAYAGEHDFNGTILVQKGGEVSYAKSFGLANIAFKVPNTLQTKYKIASITKAFTSALVLQLHEQGRST